MNSTTDNNESDPVGVDSGGNPLITADDGPAGDDRRSPVPFIAGAAAVIAVALLAIFVAGGDSTEAGGDQVAAGDNGINGLAFVNEDGSSGTLSDFEGEPLVVNFFASWCAPCRAELPDFQEVHVAAGDRVQFLGVSHDIDQSSWKGLVDDIGLTYPTVFQSEQEIWEELNLFGMPATAFIAPDGEVVYTFSGILNQEALKTLIAEHLDVEV